MNALNPSHAALIAEVTALRATLGDAIELCEALRSERDTKQRACDALKLHIDQQTNDAVRLRAALKLCVARLDEYEDAKDGIALECANLELERTAP